VLVCALVHVRRADAAGGYLDSNFQSVTTTCPVTSTYVTAASSYVGYYADINAGFPQTGDAAYVHAVVANVSGCVNDAAGIELFLPLGATQNASNPVLCVRGKLDGSFAEAVPTGSQSSCLQSAAAGANGGAFYGWSALPPGWYLEIRVPVDYQQQLLGIAGPTSHSLRAAVTSAYGTMWPAVPVTVGYRAQFDGMSVSSFAFNHARLAFTLRNYFVGGQLYVDFGPSSFASSTPGAAVGSAYASVSATSDLTGLTPDTLYYWRLRYVTANGTFTSATQTFRTFPLRGEPLPLPPPCPRGGC